MTMIPVAENIPKQHCYYGVGGGYGSVASSIIMSRLEGYGCSEACLGSDPMTENESRTESINEEAGSSCKDRQEEVDDPGWLQLSIGPAQTIHNNNKNSRRTQSEGHHGLVELDLLPQAGLISSSTSSEELRLLPPTHMIGHVPEIPAPTPPPPLFWQNPGGGGNISSFPQQQQQHQEINWAFRPYFQRNMVAASPSPSSSSLGPGRSYFARPFQVLQTGLGHVPRPVIDFRVIDPPPRRPHSGIWFMLQASQNQAKEPFLPQIPKSFLRTRDGRMTIRLVNKYLVNKLKLESESEVEIRCRGQHILPFLTLQHVRDSIWNPRDALVTLLPSHDSTSASDHVMVLHYGWSP